MVGVGGGFAVGKGGEMMEQSLLGQVAEPVEQALGGVALLGPERRHEEVDVVEHRHVVVGVRQRGLDHLTPSVLHTHTCTRHHDNQGQQDVLRWTV